MPDLDARSLRLSVLSVTVGSGAYALVNFASSLLITRAIGAEQYGNFTIGLAVYGLVGLLIDGGHGRSLLAAREDIAAADRAARTWVRVTSVVLVAIACLTAPAVARLFGSPHATPAIVGCAAAVLASAIGLTDSMVLRRLNDATYVQWVSVAANIVAYLGLGVVVSLLTASWVGPVAAAFAYGAVTSAAFRHRRRTLAPHLGRSDRWASARPEPDIFASSILGWAGTQVDTLTVAYAGGAAVVGAYSRAYFLAFAAPALITFAVTPVLASVLRRSDGATRLLTIGAALFAMNLPLVAASYLLDDVTQFVYGPGFGSAKYFRLLVIAGALWAAALPWSLSLQLRHSRRAEAVAQALPLVAFFISLVASSDPVEPRRVALAVVVGAVVRLACLAGFRHFRVR